MASSTPNLGLTLPVGGEHVSRQIINANNVKIDEAVGPVPSGTDLQSQVSALNNNITNVSNSVFSIGGTEVTTARDFHTFTAPGVYRFASNSVITSCTNKPCNFAGKLTVWSISNRNLDTAWENGGLIYRDYNGDEYMCHAEADGSGNITWGSWRQFALRSDVLTSNAISMPSGTTSFNSLTTPGRYTLFNGTLDDAPASGIYGYLDVINYSGFIAQNIYSYTSSGVTIYLRRRNDSNVWSSWTSK